MDEKQSNDTGNNEEEHNSWIIELESALLSNCDLQVLQKICNEKAIPMKLRPEFWQACLNVKGKTATLTDFFDLEEQNLIRNDCQNLVENLGNNEEEKVSVLSDVESILTTYAKKYEIKYSSNNGWLEIMQPILALKLPIKETYNCFEAIMQKFIPKNFHTNLRDDDGDDDQAFNFFRLLLLYHDPELCSFLDTRKITPDMYIVTWVRSLFSAQCSIKVIQSLWDVYFQLDNPSLLFFLSLVMLVNAKEQVMEMKDECKEKIIDTLKSVPSALDVEDIGDLFYLVEQHYISQTPSSIDKLTPLIFSKEDKLNEVYVNDLSDALCLPIPIEELIPSSLSSSKKRVKYFVVDCRPAEQYNNGHLSTAFHLDCSLMLQEPVAFQTAVQTLLSAQKQAIDSGSSSGGNHLCFIGTGRIEDDQFVHMVISSFLKKNHHYVSLVVNGYEALHRYAFEANAIDKYLTDHNKRYCIPCREAASSNNSQNDSNEGGLSLFKKIQNTSGDQTSIFDKVATVFKSKSLEVKEKLTEYMNNPNLQTNERHVKSNDKIGKRYKASNKFSIDDADDDNEEEINGNEETEESNPEIDVEAWSKRDDVIFCHKCFEIKENGTKCPSYLLLTKSHLLILREIPHNRGYAKIMKKRPLELVVQITSKRKYPNLITFKYGQTGEGDTGPSVMATDLLHIPKAYEVTRLVKRQVVQILEGDTDSSVGSSSK